MINKQQGPKRRMTKGMNGGDGEIEGGESWGKTKDARARQLVASGVPPMGALYLNLAL